MARLAGADCDFLFMRCRFNILPPPTYKDFFVSFVSATYFAGTGTIVAI